MRTESLLHSANTTQVLQQLRNVIEIERSALSHLLDTLSVSAAEAVDILFACTGRVLVCGMGKSGLVGRKISATLSSTGTPSFYLHPAEAHHGDLGIAAQGDVMIACSYSGETEELIQLLPHCHRTGIPIIALTGRTSSTLARLSDCVIDVSVDREADPLNIAPTASTTTLLAMGDALSVALLIRRGFTREQFGIFHPGGSIGRKLLLKVKDLMHTEDAVPIVSPDVRIDEAIYSMSEKRLGCVFVTAPNGQLQGVFTDGDLRRLLQHDEHPLSRHVHEVMIHDPKSISDDSLAADAAKMMEQCSITVLPVVDQLRQVCGAIHLHDLVKAGFA